MKAAQKAYKEAGLPVIILAPTFMFGPFDTKPGSGKMIVAQSMGKLPAYTSGGRNFVAVTDVATAVVNALTLGRLGECYILGGDNYSYREIFQIIDQVAHKRSRQLYVPGPLLRFFGHLASAIAKVRGKQPMLTAKMAWVASTDQFYSAEKARKEIGLPHTPIEVAVQDAYNWFSENGYLDRSA